MPIWGGSTAIPRLMRDVELLFAIGLLEPAADAPHRLTALGEQVFAANPKFGID